MVRPHIGTLREKALHASVKEWYRSPGDRVEVPIGGFVIDLVRDDLLVEVQTRGFSSMKRKLQTLLGNGHRVRIVHPIAVDKWIVKIDADGEQISRRRSPIHGSAVDIFSELAAFPELIVEPGLELEVLLTRQEEHRAHRPDGPWRRRGWAVVERSLLEVVETVPLRDVEALTNLLPRDLPSPFSTADLASGLGRPRRLAQQVAYCLRKCGAIALMGKEGNALLYEPASQEPFGRD